jgi:hypothetical protein
MKHPIHDMRDISFSAIIDSNVQVSGTTSYPALIYHRLLCRAMTKVNQCMIGKDDRCSDSIAR